MIWRRTSALLAGQPGQIAKVVRNLANAPRDAHVPVMAADAPARITDRAAF